MSCNIINPDESVPTYIHIDSIKLENTDPNKTGTISSNIVCAWVYYNNQTVGVFDIPGTFPVIAEGEGELLVIPGVSFDGISDFNAQYPFYSSATMTFDAKPGGTIEYNPIVRYLSDANFRWTEDFEVGNNFEEFTSGLTNDTMIVRVNKNTQPDKVFEGAGSGYIYLDGSTNLCEVVSNRSFALPQTQIYLEVNYKNTIPFEVGMVATDNSDVVQTADYIVGANPSAEWNKIYIGLRDFTSSYNADKYKLLIKAELPEGTNSGYVLLDNIKIVSF